VAKYDSRGRRRNHERPDPSALENDVQDNFRYGPEYLADPEHIDEAEAYDEEASEPGAVLDEEGRRHVRRRAPQGTEELREAKQARHTALPDKVEAWRRRSATGAIVTAMALGLQEAFEPDRKQPSIIMQTSGEPPKDLPVEAQLEQLGPRRSTINVRPWLLGEPTHAEEAPPPAKEGPSPAEEGKETGDT